MHEFGGAKDNGDRTWDLCFLCSVFLRVVLCVLCFYMCFSIVKSLNKLGENKNNKRNIQKKQNNSKNNKQTTEIQNIQPSTRPPAHELPRKINISKGLAGRLLFFYLNVFLRVFMCFLFLYVFFLDLCDLFAEVRGLDILYSFCLFINMFFFELFCCFYVSLCFFLFSPSLFKLLHLQSNKTHIKT